MMPSRSKSSTEKKRSSLRREMMRWRPFLQGREWGRRRSEDWEWRREGGRSERVEVEFLYLDSSVVLSFSVLKVHRS